jgi:predicted ATPase
MELAERLGETSTLFPATWWLWRFNYLHEPLSTSLVLAEQCLSMAEKEHDTSLLLPAHYALGGTFLFRGDFIQARTHLKRGYAYYNPQKHQSLAFKYGTDLGVWCLSYGAWSSWPPGYPDEALGKIETAISLAEKMSHPFSLGSAFAYAAWLNIMCRDERAAFEYAERSVALGGEHGFPQVIALGSLSRGLALTELGQIDEGISEVKESIVALRGGGAKLGESFYLSLLAERCVKSGRIEEGHALLAEALIHVEEYGEPFWEAEIHRLKGEFLLKKGAQESEAESCFRKALEVSRGQKAKSLELRAAMSMARLWKGQGKKDEARELLGGVYNWFTEGFDTQDLQDAKALLEEL